MRSDLARRRACLRWWNLALINLQPAGLVVALALTGAKIAGALAWSWWWVAAPVLVPVGLAVAAALLDVAFFTPRTRL